MPVARGQLGYRPRGGLLRKYKVPAGEDRQGPSQVEGPHWEEGGAQVSLEIRLAHPGKGICVSVRAVSASV